MQSNHTWAFAEHAPNVSIAVLREESCSLRTLSAGQDAERQTRCSKAVLKAQPVAYPRLSPSIRERGVHTQSLMLRSAACD